MSVWQARDGLVLEYIMANPPYHGMLYVDTQSDAAHPDLPAVTEWELHLSIETLGDAGYLSWTNTGAESGGTRHYQDILVTGAGKQALGLWPHFDALGSPAELADLLEAIAADAATDEERSNLRTAAASVRRASPAVIRATLVGALGALARSQIGV